MLLATWIAACSSDEDKAAPSNTGGSAGNASTGGSGASSGTDGSGASGGSGASSGTGGQIVDVQFGLDERPSNPTCHALPPPAPAGDLTLTRVFEELNLPGALTALTRTRFAENGTRYWFAAARTGEIIAFSDGATASSDTQSLTTLTVGSDSGEGGLLALVVDPDFIDNHWLYVSYSQAHGQGACPARTPGETSADTQPHCKYVVRYEASVSDSGEVSLGGAVPLFQIRQPTWNHLGGALAFTDGGELLYSMGDGGGGEGQFLTTASETVQPWLGKILRFDFARDASPSALVVDSADDFDESFVFASGFRNPWRITTDRLTGELWVGDVGESAREEVDRVSAGEHYGWNCYEGSHLSMFGVAKAPPCPNPAALLPTFEYAYGSGRSFVVGGYRYRGTNLPGYAGYYFFADGGSREIWAKTPEATTLEIAPSEAGFAQVDTAIYSFAEDDEGELYVLSSFSGVYRIDPAGDAPPDTFPTLLSQTGCMQSDTPSEPAAGLIPFGVTAELWSDGADKQRWLALPDGETISVEADGDFTLPNGTVLVKQFGLEGRLLETRLLMRGDDGSWAGYTYVWNEQQTDATLIDTSETLELPDQTWTFPSRADCLTCHTAAAGRSLGLEVAQLDAAFVYPEGRRANQLATLEHIGLFSTELPAITPLAGPDSNASLSERARSYLHANCSHCHRPDGGTPAQIDLRFSTALENTGIWDALPERGTLDVDDARIVAPGDPARSVLYLRMITPEYRMPQIGSNVEDEIGASLISDWISDVE